MDETLKKTGQILDFQSEDMQFFFSRSSGPGGQNVNKVNTRVTLVFNLPVSTRFTEPQKVKIRHALKNRLDKDGCIQIHCQRYRSQFANREAALERLRGLIQAALKPRKIRKKTKIPRSVTEKRLRAKKHRSEIKRFRSGPAAPE